MHSILLRYADLGHSPHLKPDPTVPIDKLKISSVGGDETGAVRAGGEGDEKVKMQVTEFMRLKAPVCTDLGQYLARFQPIGLRRGQDRVASRQSAEESVFQRSAHAPQQFREDNRRHADQALHRLDTLAVATGADLVQNDGRVKITTSLIESGKLEFAGVLLHQLLEALQPNNFAQSDVHRIGAGFRLEHLHGLVGQVGVEAD
jgi:hypothetical protein